MRRGNRAGAAPVNLRREQDPPSPSSPSPPSNAPPLPAAGSRAFLRYGGGGGSGGGGGGRNRGLGWKWDRNHSTRVGF